MAFPSADRIFRRLAEDKRQSERNRLVALSRIARPSLSMLRRLLHPSTPARLRFKAAELFEVAMTRHELLRKEPSEQQRNDPANNLE
jgi:hypothetical protein